MDLGSVTGVETQRETLQAAAEQRGWELVNIVADEGESGGKRHENRPGLGAAISPIEAGEADALAVAKLDRLSRSVRDLADLAERSRPKGKQKGWGLTAERGGRLVLRRGRLDRLRLRFEHLAEGLASELRLGARPDVAAALDLGSVLAADLEVRDGLLGDRLDRLVFWKCPRSSFRRVGNDYERLDSTAPMGALTRLSCRRRLRAMDDKKRSKLEADDDLEVDDLDADVNDDAAEQVKGGSGGNYDNGMQSGGLKRAL